MNRSVPWFWIVLAGLLLLAPSPAGRFLLDVLGGITLLLLLLPLVLAGAGVIAWQILSRRLRTCQACGFTSLGSEVCPACGTPFGAASGGSEASVGSVAARSFGLGGGGASGLHEPSGRSVDASDVTIDVEAHAVADEGGGAPP